MKDSRRADHLRGPSDASLIRNSAADPAAFGELYSRHVGEVYRWFRRRIEWAASDLTAETFARAWLARSRFRDERDGSALPPPIATSPTGGRLKRVSSRTAEAVDGADQPD